MGSKKHLSKIKKVKDRYEYIGWVGALLVLFGYYLNANHCLSSWLVWIVGNLCIAGYSTYKKAWPTVAMSIAIVIMNIYGYFHWS
jgi:hypothetical protein